MLYSRADLADELLTDAVHERQAAILELVRTPRGSSIEGEPSFRLV